MILHINFQTLILFIINFPLQFMDLQRSRKKRTKKIQNQSSSSSNNEKDRSRNLFALIGGQSMQLKPYRSKIELNSIASGKSRQSRDSDLLNRLGNEPSKASSKSLSRNISHNNLNHKSLINSNSNSLLSDGSFKHYEGQSKMVQTKEAPKIHNCVCFVAGECLSYNCNCFLSPFPCAPECCPNCLMLKSTLPIKVANMCSCKKTKCLKLYCECLSKGQFCSVMCRCELCQNHQHSNIRNQFFHQNQQPVSAPPKGCTCQKSHCKKKYCECYANDLKCTERCNCIQCHNFLKLVIGMDQQNSVKVQSNQMDIQIPQLQFEPFFLFDKNTKK